MNKIKLLIVIFILAITVSCRVGKDTSTISVEKQEIIKTDNVKNDSIVEIKKIPEILENTSIPISTDKDGNIKDFDLYKKIGELEVWYGIKEGKQYFNYKKPEEVITNSKVTKESNSTYSNTTDKFIEKYTKIWRGFPRWMLILILFALLIFIFRKSVIRMLSHFFPQLKLIRWLSKLTGTNGDYRIGKLEQAVYRNEDSIDRQVGRLGEIKNMLQELIDKEN